MHDIVNNKRGDFERVLEYLKGELASVRTGRASVSLVDTLQVEAYGTAQPLKNLASISTPDARTIRVEPWDAGIVAAIDKALQESDIGIHPVVDGKVIRLNVPPMTEEARKQLLKNVGKRVEEARIAVRQAREETRKQIEVMEKAKDITQDDRYGLQEELDTLVGEFNRRIETMGAEKEAQIKTV